MAKQEDKKPLQGIEELQEDLYSRDASRLKADAPKEDPVFKMTEAEIPTDWPTADLLPKENLHEYKKLEGHVTLFKKILLGSVLVFALACAFAAYRIFSAPVSTENVDISIQGPLSIGAGEDLSFDVVIQNQNNVDLHNVNFLMEFPAGTVSADSAKTPLAREVVNLGTIKAGSSVKKHVDAVLFGESNSIKDIKASLEYRVQDSSATYFKEKAYSVAISNAPIRMIVDSLKEVISGKDVQFTVHIQSNSASAVKNVLLKVDYPFGFTFKSSSPEARYGNNGFLLGDLSPGDERVITINGKLEGQSEEQRDFRFTIGQQSATDAKSVGLTYLVTDQLLTLKAPFVGIGLNLGGLGPDLKSTPAGSAVDAEISWNNNLPTRITDFEIQAKVTGDALDKPSIQSIRGFYQSADNTVTWNKTTGSEFASIDPGQSGTANFSFNILPASQLIYSGLKAHTVTIDVSIRAKRYSDANVPEEIISTLTRTLKIDSNLTLAGKSLYFTGPFKNTGPVPPTADNSTTYTIVWDVTNSLNDVTGAKVAAVLPVYMTWLGQVSPSSEDVTFDPLSRQIIWNIGGVKAGAGPLSAPREVAFQVSILSSLSQVGTVPNLVESASLSGVDVYTGKTLTDSGEPVTTNISDTFMRSGDNATVIK